MVVRDEREHGTRPEAAHARIDLVDRVPGQALLDSSDRLQALAAVALQSAPHVVVVGSGLLAPTLAVALLQNPAGQAQRRVARELAEQQLEVARRQLDVAVELGDVREGGPVGVPEPPIEGPRGRGDGEPVLRRVLLRGA